jgi:hypothetical protein
MLILKSMEMIKMNKTGKNVGTFICRTMETAISADAEASLRSDKNNIWR